MSMYRIGRHNLRIVYWQDGTDPDNHDRIVAVFFNEVEARTFTTVMNEAQGHTEPNKE